MGLARPNDGGRSLFSECAPCQALADELLRDNNAAPAPLAFLFKRHYSRHGPQRVPQMKPADPDGRNAGRSETGEWCWYCGTGYLRYGPKTEHPKFEINSWRGTVRVRCREVQSSPTKHKNLACRMVQILGEQKWLWQYRVQLDLV